VHCDKTEATTKSNEVFAQDNPTMNANGLNGLRLSGNSTGPERSPFTIENIPYGVISTRQNSRKRCATAFEDSAVDLQVLEERAFFKDIAGINSAVFAHVSFPARV
jgi:hypothetical protein